MNKHKHRAAEDRVGLKLPEASDGTFLSLGEDEQKFLDFRTRQVLRLEPKRLLEMQLALSIADVGWQIHFYLQTLDHLTPLTTTDEASKDLNSTSKPIEPKYSGVRWSYRFDHTMVPFARITRALQVEPMNVKLIETRIAESGDHVECLSASLRAVQAAGTGVAYVFGRGKLH